MPDGCDWLNWKNSSRSSNNATSVVDAFTPCLIDANNKANQVLFNRFHFCSNEFPPDFLLFLYSLIIKCFNNTTIILVILRLGTYQSQLWLIGYFTICISQDGGSTDQGSVTLFRQEVDTFLLIDVAEN